MWKYNFFIISMFLCARVSSTPVGVLLVSDVLDGKTEDAAEKLFENSLLTDSNSKQISNTTGTQEELKTKECAGGLLGFIKCVVASKIESFRKTLSQIAFPESPQVFQQYTMDSRIQGSLEEWLQDLNKHISIAAADKNFTCDKSDE